MTLSLKNLLAGFVAGAVSAFLTATILFVLLARLGDETGSTWAGRVSIVAGGLTVVALAMAYLFEPVDRRVDD